MKVFHCRCGVNVEGVTEDELVDVNAYITADHPELAGKYSTEQILEMAHDH